MFGQHRDIGAYAASLKRLQQRDDFDWIYPSHAKEKISRDVIPQLIEGAERIAAGEAAWTEAEVHGNKIRVVDAGIARFLM